jgi:integrase/recombinase XerD
MPLDQVQKFLRHKRITTTQIYGQTSLQGMSDDYLRAFGGKQLKRTLVLLCLNNNLM